MSYCRVHGKGTFQLFQYEHRHELIEENSAGKVILPKCTYFCDMGNYYSVQG